MGNNITIRNVLPQGWQQLSPTTFENTQTGYLVDAQTIILPDWISFEQYTAWYQCRLSPSTRYPRVIHYALKSPLCCVSKKEIVVFTEKIHRLQDVKLSPQQTTYLFQQAILGFRQLILTFGKFIITPGMIGLNQNGQLKIWMNQNYAQNHFEDQQDETLTEEDVINSLISILDKKQQSKHLDLAFRQFSYCRTFDTAISFIKQLQSRKQQSVKRVPLNKCTSEAVLKNSAQFAIPPLDLSFLAKVDNLEFSFASKIQPSEIMRQIPKINPTCANIWRKSRTVHPLQPLQQVKPFRLNSFQNNLPNIQSIKYSRVNHPTTPIISPLITSNNQSALKSQRSSLGAIGNQSRLKMSLVADRHSTDIISYVQPQQIPLNNLPRAHPERRFSNLDSNTKPCVPNIHQLKNSKVLHNIPIVAKNFGNNQLERQLSTESTVHTCNQTQSIHMQTLRSNISHGSINQMILLQASRPQHSQLTNHDRFLDWTLNKMSIPALQQTTHAKKSDAERLMQYRHAQMYKTIPKVDSMIIISRSDKNDVVDVMNAHQNYKLIQSTIVRDLSNFNQ